MCRVGFSKVIKGVFSFAALTSGVCMLLSGRHRLSSLSEASTSIQTDAMTEKSYALLRNLQVSEDECESAQTRCITTSFGLQLTGTLKFNAPPDQTGVLLLKLRTKNNKRSSSLIYVALHPTGSGGGGGGGEGSFVSDLLLHSSACDAAPSAGPAVTHELRHRQRH